MMPFISRRFVRAALKLRCALRSGAELKLARLFEVFCGGSIARLEMNDDFEFSGGFGIAAFFGQRHTKVQVGIGEVRPQSNHLFKLSDGFRVAIPLRKSQAKIVARFGELWI